VRGAFPEHAVSTTDRGTSTERLQVEGEHAWRVCLRRADGRILGAGVLVDRFHVLTCAHVVTRNLDLTQGAVAPAGELVVELPFAPQAGGPGGAPVRMGARVADYGWAPPSVSGSGDLALLRLHQAAPEGCAVARLAPEARRSGDLLVFGYAEDLSLGAWTQTRVMGSGGPGGEWLQLDAAAFSGRSIDHGYSGAGAVDERTGDVVAIVVAKDRAPGTRVAWAIRIATAVRYLPSLAHLARLAPLPAATASRAGADPRVEDVAGAATSEDVARPGPGSGSADGRPRLGEAERARLLDLLCAVPEMMKRPARDQYLQALVDQTGSRPSFTRHDNDRLDVMAVMEMLLGRKRGLRELLSVLRPLYPGSPELGALEEFADRVVPDRLLQHAERVELVHLLDGVGPVWIGAAMISATAGLAIPPSTQPSTRSLTVPEAVHRFEGYGRLRGGPPPPLLLFVDDLAHDIGGPLSDKLHLWIYEVADRLALPHSEWAAMCSGADERRRHVAELSLVVCLVPDRVAPDRYLVSAVLMHRDRTERVLHRDDVPRTLVEVAAVLEGVLQSLPQVARGGPGGHVADPVIEFVLPRRLLHEPVEEWVLGQDDFFPLPLGLQYQVVVRSLDRIRTPRYHAGWRARSRRLADDGHRADPGAVHYLDAAGAASDPAAHARTVYARLQGHGDAVCLAVAHPPDPAPARGADVFAAGLAAGMPIMVWPRDPTSVDAFFELVRTSIAEVARLVPSRVLRHRQEVGAGQGRPDAPAHLVVLYDLPDRIPRNLRDPLQFEAPQ